jgi:hypothetical protein
MMQVSAKKVRNLKQQAKDSLMHTEPGQQLETKERLEFALEQAG